MSGSKRRPNRNRSTAAKVRPDPVTFWREDEPVLEPPLVRTSVDPTATLRSIGAPPVPGGEQAANEFLKTVLRASSLVCALADSVDLLEDDPSDDSV
jgi:hypothetical protein